MNTWGTLLDIAEKRSVPLIKEALLDAREIKLRCEIASRIRHDSQMYVSADIPTSLCNKPILTYSRTANYLRSSWHAVDKQTTFLLYNRKKPFYRR